MNAKILLGLASITTIFAACGDGGATSADEDSLGLNPAAVDYSVPTYESLPVCNDRKEGQTGYVKGTSKYYVCEGGEWVVMRKSSGSSSSVSEDKPVAGESSESSGANAGGSDPSTGILTDSRDGQKYKTIKIGDQVWMAENLNYAYLQPTADLDSSSFCYDTDPANCKEYGRLYLWSAAMDSAGVLKNDGKGKGCGYFVRCGVEGTVQGVCPEGWHLPSGEDFESLLDKVGSSEGEWSANLRDSFWSDGKNKYGFSALPAGLYLSYDKKFNHLGNNANFWSSTESTREFEAYSLIVGDDLAFVNYYSKDFGCSVRCLKDN